MTARRWSEAEMEQAKRLHREGVLLQSIAATLGRSTASIKAAIRREYKPRISGSIPADFADRWREMAIDELAVHYGMAKERAAGICRTLGLKREAGQRTVTKTVTPADLKKKPKQLPSWKPAPVTSRVGWSPADEAARFLQQTRPVSRCNAEGRPSIGGRFWRCGSVVVTDAELIERADYLRRKVAA